MRSQRTKKLKVTVTVQVAEAKVTEGKELSISYDKNGSNELTWDAENLTGATLGTLSNDLEFTQTDNDKLNGVTVKLTAADNKITFNAGSATPAEGKTYTFKATIPTDSLTLQAGYALATDAQGIEITVSVTVPTSNDPGSGDVQNQEEPSAGV